MLNKEEVRMELLKVIIPQASRVGISEPQHIIKSCLQFEEYVLGFSESSGEVPDSPPKRKGGRPKRTTDKTLSLESDPAHSG